MDGKRFFEKPPLEKYSVREIETRYQYEFEWSHKFGVINGTGVLGIYQLHPSTQRIVHGAMAIIMINQIHIICAAPEPMWGERMYPALSEALALHTAAYEMRSNLPTFVHPGTITDNGPVSASLPLVALKL